MPDWSDELNQADVLNHGDEDHLEAPAFHLEADESQSSEKPDESQSSPGSISRLL